MKKNSYLKNILTKELLEKEFAELKSSKAIGRKLGISGETISRYMEDFGLIPNKKLSYNLTVAFFKLKESSVKFLSEFLEFKKFCTCETRTFDTIQ
jgi:NADH/NAD ratio-sensing transcriptional regulator Rex